MRIEEERFVDRMGGILASEGLPPVAGRLWAWLLVCDPPEQTAASLTEAVGASRGAISGAARMLEVAGLIQRTRRRGDRHELWSAAPDAMIRVLEVRERQLKPTVEVIEAAMAELGDRPSASLDRLRDAHGLYGLFVRVFPALVDQFRTERAARVASGALTRED